MKDLLTRRLTIGSNNDLLNSFLFKILKKLSIKNKNIIKSSKKTFKIVKKKLTTPLSLIKLRHKNLKLYIRNKTNKTICSCKYKLIDLIHQNKLLLFRKLIKEVKF